MSSMLRVPEIAQDVSDCETVVEESDQFCTEPLPSYPVRRLDPNIFPPAIPPKHSERTLVLCFDGTGDHFDADNSNVVSLFSLLKKDNRREQMVYYQVRTSFFFAGARMDLNWKSVRDWNLYITKGGVSVHVELVEGNYS